MSSTHFSFKPSRLTTTVQRYSLRTLWLALGAVPLAEAQEAAQGDVSTSTAAAIATPVVASTTTQLERVQVTGSAIRRVDAETAVPVTTLKADDLRAQGVTTTAGIISRITGSQSLVNSASSVGAVTGGASFADMRGIGANKTLVLLNGRRLANNAISGNNQSGAAVDINTIPFAAIERVEVLRDGASALYGTDAIGGVINFITQKSLTEGALSVGGETPFEEGGGQSRNFSASWGYGDLDRDKFNILGVFDYNKQHSLAARDRSFSRDYVPDRGLNQTSGTAFPSNYSQGGNSSNPLAGSACNGPNLIFNRGLCRFSTRDYIDLLPETEKTSFYTKATVKLDDANNFNAEYFVARNNNATGIAPAPLTGISLAPSSPYYPGNGITPAPASFALDPSQPVDVNWREVDAGPRQQKDENTGQRLLFSFDGNLGGWDYNVGTAYNENRVDNRVTGGYLSDRAALAGLDSGLLNPFGSQSDAGLDFIRDNLLTGTYETSVGRVKSLDGRASHEVGDWFGAGPAALALGGEYRKEDFHSDIAEFAGDLSSLGVDPSGSVSGDRSVKAAYAELNVPVLDTLELTAALRHDKYSDFGSTTNPKYSFRFQPFHELVVRGAYSEGFRAPSLYELYGPTYTTWTQGNYNDPVLCTGGTVQPGGVSSRDCNQQFYNRNGGNQNLDPEKARNVTLGFVYQPVRNLSMGLDFWWIHITNMIQPFPENAVFDDPAAYADRYVRKPDGTLDYIVTGNANLGKVKTNGLDLSLDYRLPNTAYGQFGVSMQGTYTDRYDFQRTSDGPYIDKVGDFQDDGVIARWKHVVTGTWQLGAYRAALANRFTTGYRDYDPTTHERVASYTVWDLSAGYTWKKTLDLDVGIKNLFDRDPPFSNQVYNFQTGYDPRYTDPLGRTLYGKATYHF